MSMENYKVTYADGSESYFQFDDSEDAGKAGLEAFRTAAKNDDSPVKSIAKGNPPAADPPKGGT